MPTEKQWDKMREDKQVNIQTLACLHDAVAIVVRFEKKDVDPKTVSEDIKKWLDILYEIAEEKKAKITTPQPVDLEKSVKQGEEFKKNVLEAERIEEDTKYQEKREEADEEIPVINQ